MRKRLFSILGLICFALLLSHFFAANLAQESPLSEEAQQLRDLLIHPECERACILGIEPEVTTRQEVMQILEQANIPFEIIVPAAIYVDEKDGIIQFSYNVAPLIDSSVGIAIQFTDNLTRQIQVNLQVSVNVALEAFGSPDSILNIPDELRLDPIQSYPLIYEEEGLLLNVLSGEGLNGTEIFRMILAVPDSTLPNDINGFLGSPVNQPCETYGVPPCIAPTAAPIPNTYSPQAQQLRDLLIHPECEHACILGIEPEVTTKQEVFDRLQQKGIAYETFDPTGLPDDGSEGEGFIDWSYRDATLLQSDIKVFVQFNNNTVHQILLFLTIPMITVSEAFGSPDIVQQGGDTNINVVDFALLYLDEDLMFTVDGREGFDPSLAINIVLAVPDSTQPNFINGYPGTPVNQPCETYGVPPCIAPTATLAP